LRYHPAVTTISRREAIHLLGALGAASALPAGCSSERVNPAPMPFFSDDERRGLGALADAVLPPDDTPGGAALGTVAYVERLLTAFDLDPPAIFAGGPYSGRTPEPDGKGGASKTFPPNDFERFLPLDRVTEAAMRLWLYGSKGVAGGAPNDAIVGPIVGLRDRVKQGLADAMASSPAPLDTLDAEGKAAALEVDPDFRDLLVELVAEAAFSAPEYGGNPELAGWKLVHFEGDSMPLGYSLFDEGAGAYRERPEAPVSTANPGPDPDPMDDATLELLRTVVGVTGGKEFT